MNLIVVMRRSVLRILITEEGIFTMWQAMKSRSKGVCSRRCVLDKVELSSWLASRKCAFTQANLRNARAQKEVVPSTPKVLPVSKSVRLSLKGTLHLSDRTSQPLIRKIFFALRILHSLRALADQSRSSRQEWISLIHLSLSSLYPSILL